MAPSLETIDQKNGTCRVPSTILNFLRTHKSGTMECEYYGPETGHFSHSLHFSFSNEFPPSTRLNSGLWERVEDQCSQWGAVIDAPEMANTNYAQTLTAEITLTAPDVAKTLAPLLRLATQSTPRSDITMQVRTLMPQLLDDFSAQGKLRIVFGQGVPGYRFQWYCQFEFIQFTDEGRLPPVIG